MLIFTPQSEEIARHRLACGRHLRIVQPEHYAGLKAMSQRDKRAVITPKGKQIEAARIGTDAMEAALTAYAGPFARTHVSHDVGRVGNPTYASACSNARSNAVLVRASL
ncbi:MAG: hypothetical protein FJZ90_19800 [Chloroflexi bacterium]|nr:hypothetical protein [Chloroflexota bacterium]